MIIVFLIPVAILSAKVGSKPATFKDFSGIIIEIANAFVPILMSLSLIAFLWGIAKTIANSDKPEKRAEGRRVMIYGIISLFVIVSLWQILHMVKVSLIGSEYFGPGF